MDGEWATRICLQHLRFIRAENGRERFVDCLYYRDDEGSWNGPNVDWGLLPNERLKKSKSANIEILNAFDARLRQRRRVVDEQMEDVIVILEDGVIQCLPFLCFWNGEDNSVHDDGDGVSSSLNVSRFTLHFGRVQPNSKSIFRTTLAFCVFYWFTGFFYDKN